MKIEDYNEYYIQGSDHYLIPKYVFNELFNEMSNWREEAKEYKNQQKKFIEYLENEIYSFELRGTSPEYNFENVLKRILLKYKEIIGADK